MSQEPPPNQGKPRWTGIAIALFVIGQLILLPSALCTVLILPFAIGEMPAMILIFGAVPMALGAALVYAGLKSRRRD